MGNVRSGRVIDSALRKKGFSRDADADHIWYSLPKKNAKGYETQTKISHGMMGHTVDANLIARMARQLHLTKLQFLDLVDCPLDETGYRDILREQGITQTTQDRQ